MNKKIKKLIKRFIDYEIIGDDKVYTLKHTRIRVKQPVHGLYEKELKQLPVQSNKIVFDNYMGGGYGCNCKYVTEQLLRSGAGYDIVWTVKDAEQNRTQFPKEIRLVEYGTRQAMQEYATAKIWVGNYHLIRYINKGLWKKEDQTYIQLWHGSFGIKRIEQDCHLLAEDRNWSMLSRMNAEITDYWISNSSFETEIFRQAFWKTEQILEYGHPRNDIFFQKDEGYRRRIRERLPVMAEEKIVLYVPTFRDVDTGCCESLDAAGLTQSLSERFGGNWKLLVRWHPRLRRDDAHLLEQGTAGEVTSYPDIQELLFAADVVVTDYSSSIFDFLLTGRPGFIYAPDRKRYDRERGFYYPLSETPFPIAETNQELRSRILAFEEGAYRGRVGEFLRQKGSLEDGHASERVSGLIENIITEKVR